MKWKKQAPTPLQLGQEAVALNSLKMMANI